MMIENISKSEYTIVVLTDRYADKSNEFEGGVGYETSLLINSMVENIGKIIPILRNKGDKQCYSILSKRSIIHRFFR